jgi:hypothetical protein
VDTVVTHCRGREIDEKRVAAEIYHAGNARQHDNDATRTAGQSSLSFLNIGTACVVNVPFFTFAFFSFFY